MIDWSKEFIARKAECRMQNAEYERRKGELRLFS
jgi:hypothetical protein